MERELPTLRGNDNAHAVMVLVVPGLVLHHTEKYWREQTLAYTRMYKIGDIPCVIAI